MAKDRLLDALKGTKIPDYMHETLVAYILTGRPTGGFLYAILTNDLKQACGKADAANQQAIYDYVFFLVNNAPAVCWGSPERVDKWMDIQGKVELL